MVSIESSYRHTAAANATAITTAEPVLASHLRLFSRQVIATYNGVRGHRTGSNNSGAEDYLKRNKHIYLVDM